VSVERGTIFRLDFEELLPDGWEGEPAGERFVVVVSPRWLNDRVDTVLVAPTTASQVEARSEILTNVLLLPERTASGITKPSVVQLHLLYGINPHRLGERVGRVTCSDALDELVRCAAYAVGDAEHWVAEPRVLRGATG